MIVRTLELLKTIEDGFIHIQNQVSELNYEEAFIIMQDAMEGMAGIDNAIQPIIDRVGENDTDALYRDLKENINKAVNEFEKGQDVKLEDLIEQEVTPAFLKWKKEIERILKPYILS